MTDRQLFAVDGPLPRGTVVLEASAGTGKTYAIAALAARYVAEGTPLSQMMIVTFSRMATQELRARVRERLELAERVLSGREEATDEVSQVLLDGSPDELAARQSRLASALAEYDSATIATTHEFCSRMLAGLGSLAPHNDLATFVPDLTELVDEVTEDVWLQMFSDETAKDPSLTPEEALRIATTVLRHPGLPLGPDEIVRDGGRVRMEFARRVREAARERQARRGLRTYDDLMSVLLETLEDPQVGPAACARLALRYPVVLIDEFQDTDPQQWRIIEKAFVGSSTAVLIGDPKQAIYGFRGADVHSYLAAVQVSQAQSLGTNHRSDTRLVDALNDLLEGTALGQDEIRVPRVRSRFPEARLTVREERWSAPVRIRALAAPEGVHPSVDVTRPRVDADLADDVVALLSSGATLALDGGERALRRGDVAVLVSTNRRGETVRAELAERGVPAVFGGASSVFVSQAAADWTTLLQALVDPTPAHVRQVALTAFHGWDFAELATASSADLTALGATVRGWAKAWQDLGMAGLVEQALNRGPVVARLLARTDGERLVTDLRHVAQALQRAEVTGRGLGGLLDWLTDQVTEAKASDEDRSRRLETDADAVTIMTIHGSKGLEFPVVYLPDLGDRFVFDRDSHEPLVVHGGDGSGRLVDVAGAGGAGRDERWRRHLDEEAGEDLRKLYVAVTRAQCQVTMWWADGTTLPTSPLQRVLFRDRSGDANPLLAYDERSLDGLALPAGVVVQHVLGPAESFPMAREASVSSVRPATFSRVVDTTWRRTSYSGLTAGVHELAPLEPAGGADEPLEALEDADVAASAVPVPDPAPGSAASAEVSARPSAFTGLPGGTQFGSLVHGVLERLDPVAADLPAALLEACRQQGARIPVAGLEPEALAGALLPVLRTPLGPLAGDRSLAQIPVTDRLAELDFEMPLGDLGHPAALRDLADLIEAHLPADDLLAAYPDALRAEGLGEQALRGFLTGSIDALLRVGDAPRHLVVDYKTNRLGPVGAELTLGHYTATAMAQAMIASHYPLQALLYCVATHRFLSWRLAGYDPAEHLGGVLYLFVRGMGGADTALPDHVPGVFAWSPPPELVVALSDRIGGRA